MAVNITRQLSSEDHSESQTMEKSMVIHPDTRAESPAPGPDSLTISKSVPAYVHKIRIEESKSSQTVKSHHSREASVGNLVPHKFLNQAPSLRHLSWPVIIIIIIKYLNEMYID